MELSDPEDSSKPRRGRWADDDDDDDDVGARPRRHSDESKNSRAASKAGRATQGAPVGDDMPAPHSITPSLPLEQRVVLLVTEVLLETTDRLAAEVARDVLKPHSALSSEFLNLHCSLTSLF